MSSDSSGDQTARTMIGTSGNTDKLSYNLYWDAGFSYILGDGTNGTVAPGSSGSGSPGGIVVYASMPLNQYLKPDTYSDTLTVNLAY